MPNLDALEIKPKTGTEPFTQKGEPLPIDLLTVWQAQYSDVLNNTTRGTMMEVVVAEAMGCRKEGLQRDWHAYDIKTADGTKIEVKTSAYIQTWKQNKYSSPSFGISPTKGWDADTNTYCDKEKRHADVYVFCLLHHKDKASIDPLNLDQWTFFIVPTKALNEERGDKKTISPHQLRKMNALEVGYGGIKAGIAECLNRG